MKSQFILLLLLAFLTASCGSETTSDNETSTPSEVNEDVSGEIENLKKLNEDLMNAPASKMQVAAKALYKAAADFANNHPTHEDTPAVLEMAAMASEAMGNYQEAANILDKLINEFPETSETPKYMINKAHLVEGHLGNIDAAKEAYIAVVERFPNDPLAQEAQLYVENFLGKSQEDIIYFLDSLNSGK